MLLVPIILAVLLELNYVCGVDVNSLIPRENCYGNEQPGCNEEFIDAYPHLSKSVTGLTNATTWFLLFTRESPDNPEKLHKCAGNLPPNSNFKRDKRLIVILVPYTTGMCDTGFQREWVVQFLEREDANVLAVDYSWGNHIDIETVNQNIKIVANQTVIVLKNIQEKTEITKKQIYLMGLSLGAQLAGLIGYQFPVGRITGIDPGGPGYPEERPLEERLDRTDAELVEVWHVNAGQCIPYFGIGYDAGDVDFWINDGLNQPSCFPYAICALIRGDTFYGLLTLLIPTLCSHTMGAQYYKVSINPGDCQFLGVKCESTEKFLAGGCRSCGKTGENCLIMGFDTDKYIIQTEEHQKYYVHTKFQCPYCDKKFPKRAGYESTYNSSIDTC